MVGEEIFGFVMNGEDQAVSAHEPRINLFWNFNEFFDEFQNILSQISVNLIKSSVTYLTIESIPTDSDCSHSTLFIPSPPSDAHSPWFMAPHSPAHTATRKMCFRFYAKKNFFLFRWMKKSEREKGVRAHIKGELFIQWELVFHRVRQRECFINFPSRLPRVRVIAPARS